MKKLMFMSALLAGACAFGEFEGVAVAGGYVPGLQQTITPRPFKRYATSKAGSVEKRFSHTLGTILADLDDKGPSEVMNKLTGKNERWDECDLIEYEGEIFLEAGKPYNFFMCVDNAGTLEIGGETIVYSMSDSTVRVGSMRFPETKWYPIRVFLDDHGGERGALTASVGFKGLGIGWNTVGCTKVDKTTKHLWKPLYDDGKGHFLRSTVLPQAKPVIEGKATVNGYTWSYRIQNGEATIISEKDGRFSCAVSPTPKGVLTIPATLNGAKVTRIGRDALRNCKEVMVAILPEGLTSIGRDALADCENLTAVSLPESLKQLEWGAFGNCHHLIAAKLPSGLQSIGPWAFNECKELVLLTIPSTVESIAPEAFWTCTNLKTVNMEKEGKIVSVPVQEFRKRYKID